MWRWLDQDQTETAVEVADVVEAAEVIIPAIADKYTI